MLTCSSWEAWGAIVWLASILRKILHSSHISTKICVIFSWSSQVDGWVHKDWKNPKFLGIWHCNSSQNALSLFSICISKYCIIKNISDLWDLGWKREIEAFLAAHKHFCAASQMWGEIWHQILEIGMWESLISQDTPLAFICQLFLAFTGSRVNTVTFQKVWRSTGTGCF